MIQHLMLRIKVKLQRVLKADVSRTIMPILTKLGRKYSPIHSELNFFLIVFISINTPESNFRIHTYEDHEWIMKGKYDAAIEDDDEIS